MSELIGNHSVRRSLENSILQMDKRSSVIMSGTITRITGMKVEAIGLSLSISTPCKIIVNEGRSIKAEVIGFSGELTYLMALESVDGIKPGCKVVAIESDRSIKVGEQLLGRVIDSLGNPIDNKGRLELSHSYPLLSKPINPLQRKRISAPLDVGIRAINALLTVGVGQRIGIFAGSGVGKSILLGMMTKYSRADVVVVGLIGERGREVKEFIEENLGEEGLAKAVVVAAPADLSPLSRVNGAYLANSIAEYFRDQGLNVLLIVDSLTRFAQAQREVSLAIGEMPATKGYTPSVFGKISQLVERSGNGAPQQGSITAFYTVLVENDDMNDPIGDHVRSVLDGHIVLSRQLADMGHYPAIDIEASISRVMTAIVPADQLKQIIKFKQLYSLYQQNKELIHVGMYQAGTDKRIDAAIKFKDILDHFLKQDVNESVSMIESIEKLMRIFNE